MTTTVRVDPTTISTVWHSLQRICWEMRHVIDRTGQSYLITQLHDISVGLWDANAQTVAIPVGLPVQFLAGKFTIRYMMDKFGDDIHPGDVYLSNDPYHGHSCHLPDWGFVRPIFYKDRLLFFALARGHQMDTGAHSRVHTSPTATISTPREYAFHPSRCSTGGASGRMCWSSSGTTCGSETQCAWTTMP